MTDFVHTVGLYKTYYFLAKKQYEFEVKRRKERKAFKKTNQGTDFSHNHKNMHTQLNTYRHRQAQQYIIEGQYNYTACRTAKRN